MHLASTAVLNRMSSSFLRSGERREDEERERREDEEWERREDEEWERREDEEWERESSGWSQTYDFASLGSNEAVKKSS